MGAEVLLYGYGLVCASMLVFNLLYGLHLRSDDRRMERRTGRLRRQVEKQLDKLYDVLEVEILDPSRVVKREHMMAKVGRTHGGAGARKRGV